MTVAEKKKLLDSIFQESSEFIKSSPDGSITVSKVDNHFRYYRTREGRREYLGKDSIEIIKKLALKKYCKTMVSVINEFRAECTLLAEDNEFFKKLGNVYYRLHKEIRQYVEPFVLPEDLFVKQWLCKEITQNPYGYGNTEFYTENNERVRSKSELIIADRLKKAGIPYRYEKELVLSNGMKYYPDFTILDVASRKELYIEHCGMMDNPEYRTAFYKKMANYAVSGITTGKNLILFFEEKDSSLNTLVVDKTISSIFGNQKQT